MANATKADVVKAWSEKSGRQDQYDVREVTDFEGRVQTQLIDKDTGSLSVAVDGKGADAYERLVREAGSALLDDGIAPKESTSTDSEVQRTSRGVLATPTQPEALSDPSDPVVVDHTKPEDAEIAQADVPTHVNPVTGGSALGADSDGNSSQPKEPSAAAKAAAKGEAVAPKDSK